MTPTGSAEHALRCGLHGSRPEPRAGTLGEGRAVSLDRRREQHRLITLASNIHQNCARHASSILERKSCAMPLLG
jgi:hypothetical protein